MRKNNKFNIALNESTLKTVGAYKKSAGPLSAFFSDNHLGLTHNELKVNFEQRHGVLLAWRSVH